MPETASLHDAALHGDIDSLNQLLAEGAEPNTRDDQGQTPLMVAARYGEDGIVRHLLKYGADPNALPVYGTQTPLRHAVREGYASIVRLLLAHNASPDVVAPSRRRTDDEKSQMQEMQKELGKTITGMGLDLSLSAEPDDMTPVDPWPGRIRVLMQAVMSQSVETIQALLEAGYSPDLTPEESATRPLGSITVLGQAASFAPLEINRLLLDYGADPNNGLGSAVMQGRHDLVRILLEAGADPQHDGSNLPPLVVAQFRNDVEMVNLLLEFGAVGGPMYTMALRASSPDATEAIERGNGTYWLRDVRAGNVKAVQVHLDKGVDLDIVDERDETALMVAASSGDLEMARMLLEAGADPNKKSESGRHLSLHRAILKDHLELVRLLLESGANLNTEDQGGLTPLILASQRRNEEIVALLVEAGAQLGIVEYALLDQSNAVRTFLREGTSVDYANEAGQTALMAAALRADVPLMMDLLGRGAGLETRDRSGQTPLFYALYGGNEDAIRFLLNRGADVSATSNHRMTVTQKMVMAGNVEILRLLLERGAPLDGWLDQPLLALALLGENQQQEKDWVIVRILLEFGVDPNAKDLVGEPILAVAIRRNAPLDLIQIFLDKGAELNFSSEDTAIAKVVRTAPTPLMAAVETGRLEVVDLLLHAGANPNGGVRRKNPLSLAQEHGFTEIAERLLAAGAIEPEPSEVSGLPFFGGGNGGAMILDFAKMLAEANEQRRAKRNEEKVK